MYTYVYIEVFTYIRITHYLLRVTCRLGHKHYKQLTCTTKYNKNTKLDTASKGSVERGSTVGSFQRLS